MDNLGIHYASQIGVAPAEDPNWTQFGASTEEARVGIMLPTPEVPGIVMGLLQASVEASRQLPLHEVLAAQALTIQRQLQNPVEAFGVRLAAEGDMLLVNVGVGTLAFKLTDAAKDELAQIGRELG